MYSLASWAGASACCASEWPNLALQDALRDLRDLGSHIPVHNNVQSLDKVTNTPQDGVMFM